MKKKKSHHGSSGVEVGSSFLAFLLLLLGGVGWIYETSCVLERYNRYDDV